MTELTAKEVKLISLGLEVNKLHKITRENPTNKIFEKMYENRLDDYFFLRFEINREKIEDKRIEEMTKKGFSQSESIFQLSSARFQERAYQKCVDGLGL